MFDSIDNPVTSSPSCSHHKGFPVAEVLYYSATSASQMRNQIVIWNKNQNTNLTIILVHELIAQVYSLMK